MSSRTLRTLLVLTLTFAGAASAQELKMGYVDLQRALAEVEEGRQAKARLQKMFDDKQKDIDKRQEALRKEGEVLKKQATAMTEEILIQKQTEYQKKVMELAQDFEKSRGEMAQKERTELQAIFTKMDPLIAEIAKREGLSMVFEKTDSGLVYALASMDITNELVRMYNDKNKAAAKNAAAPKK